MNLLYWLKSGALFSVIVFLGFGSVLVYKTTQAEDRIIPQITATISSANAAINRLNSAIDQTNKTLAIVSQTTSDVGEHVSDLTDNVSGVVVGLRQTVTLINAPCVPGPCGTVSDVGKTLNTFRLTAGQLELAANSFDTNQNRFYSQEDALYSEADQSFTHFNALLTSHDLTGSIHNFDTISSNLSETTTDFQTKFHALLYPPPCRGFACHMKEVYTGFRIGAQFAEPAYWGWALFSGIHP